MTSYALDPLIHDPARLRIVATLAALPDGAAVATIRLQKMLRLPLSSLSTRLRELDDASYLRTVQTPGLDGGQTAVALTRDGRAALDRYATVLQQLTRAARHDHQPAGPELRAGDADRDATAAALGEHFAHGRLTFDELTARLDAALTATTHGELAQAARDLPTLTLLSARDSSRHRMPRA